ncbi:MAG: sugar transferase, partial [Deltaproteobacteria bacterium]|nr:sugar transferase [Deltaproteobacteria bacterium]
MVLVSIFMYFLHIQGISRLLMGIFLIVNISLLTLSKFIIFKTLEKIRTGGLNTKNILIVGSKYQARQVIEVVEEHKATGYKILGCFDIDKKMLGQLVLNEHHVIGLVDDLEEYLRNNIVDELIFAIPLKELEKGDRYLAFAESLG